MKRIKNSTATHRIFLHRWKGMKQSCNIHNWPSYLFIDFTFQKQPWPFLCTERLWRHKASFYWFRIYQSILILYYEFLLFVYNCRFDVRILFLYNRIVQNMSNFLFTQKSISKLFGLQETRLYIVLHSILLVFLLSDVTVCIIMLYHSLQTNKSRLPLQGIPSGGM